MSNIKFLSSVALLEFLKKFSADAYIIALPAIAASLETGRGSVQILLTVFFLAIAIVQFFAGPLSDYLGRRIVLLSLLPLFIIGALISALFQGLFFLHLGVLCMGMGVGAAPVLGKALIHDLHPNPVKTAYFLVLTSLIVTWAPAIAMVVGGNVVHFFGWEFVFVLMSAMGLLTLALVFIFLPKEPVIHKLSAFSMLKMLSNYGAFLQDPLCWRYLLLMAFLGSGVVVYYASTTFIFYHELGLPLSIIGLFAFAIVASNLFGKMQGTLFFKGAKIHVRTYISFSLVLIAACSMLFFAHFFSPKLGFILFPMVVYMVGLGMFMPNAHAQILHAKPGQAGLGSSLSGVIVALCCAFSSWVLSFFHAHTVLPLGAIILGIAMLGFLFQVTLKRTS